MANNYNNLSKDELLKVIDKLKSRKKYGIVWEEERIKEQFEKESENALPVLREIKNKEIITNSSYGVNILIEGDNYHVLSVLNYTHQNAIDLIYIDPPYNTGNNDFKYNDSYVDKEDGYRHSKWLSFMNKRLRLAKNLLKDEGVIFISIDDNEYAQLKLLMDEIFYEDNFIGTVVRRRRKSQANLSKNLSTIHEYLLCYQKSSRAKLYKTSDAIQKDSYKNPDKDPRGPYVTMPCSNKGGALYEIITPTGKKYTDEWRFKEETYNKLLSEKRIAFPDKGNGKPRYKLFLNEKMDSGVIPNTWWDDVASNQEATRELKNLFGGELVLDNPKPLGLIKQIIKLVIKSEGIVLDFFAGSGTTGHAVLEVNKENNWNIKFILSTNNENNICTEVCYPRIEKAIEGYKTVSKEEIVGLKGNLKYFKTSFVKKTLNQDQNKINITTKCTEMLCLKEGIFNLVKEADDYRIFNQDNRIMAVYYSFLNDSIKDLKKQLDRIEGKKILYCFTLDAFGLDKNNFIDWDDVILEPIPQKILDVYEEIYEY